MNDSNLIKTEFNNETSEYFTNYFLEKPCTPGVMDYLLYNMFDKPFSTASSSTEFDESDENNNISEMESFIIQVAKKYLHHYHFLSQDDQPVKGMIEAWIHNDDNENETEYPVRNVHDLFDIDEDENVYTVIFWMTKGGVMEYGYSEDSFEEEKNNENDENKKYVVPIESNMVMILPDYVYYKPYLPYSSHSHKSQQYIMVHVYKM